MATGPGRRRGPGGRPGRGPRAIVDRPFIPEVPITITYDALPTLDWQNPAPLADNAWTRTWSWSSFPFYPPPVVVAYDVLPTSDWQTPASLPDHAWTRTWIWNPLTLRVSVGLPPGKPAIDLPPRAPAEPATRTWTAFYNPNLVGQDKLPVGAELSDLVPRDYLRSLDLRTWTWKYNQNLVGKDQLPAGEQIYDLAPRGYPEPATRTWLWQYNPNLVAQDRFPPGAELSDLPPRAPAEPATRSWLVNLSLTTLNTPVGARIYDRLFDPTGSARTWIGLQPPTPVAVTLPFGETDWPLTRAPEQVVRTWTASYNLNLIAQDVLPSGEQITDLPPRDYLRLQELRTWAWSYNRNLVGKDALPAGEQIYDLSPRGYPEPATRTWLFSYNPNLVGQDVLPAGEISTELPPRAAAEPATRTWLLNLSLTTLNTPVGSRLYDRLADPRYPGQTWIGLPVPVSVAVPFAQDDWPTPRPYAEPATRTWTWSYNLSLIGQDRLPVGAVIDRVPTPPPRLDQSWLRSYNLNLIGQDQLPVGIIVDELPPRDYARLFQTWASPANLALITVVPPSPHNQFDWPLPRPLTQPERTVTASYNPNLVGQDQLPPGKPFYDLAPKAYPEPATRTWTFTYSLDLVAQDRFPPGARVVELAPVAPSYPSPHRAWAWWYNQNLIAQDQLPVGRIVTDLSPRSADQGLRSWVSALNLALAQGPQTPFAQLDWPLTPAAKQPDRTWISFFNLNLIGQDRFPPGARSFELAPVAPPHPTQNRSWIWWFNQNLFGQDQLPAGEVVTDLTPRDYQRAQDLRTWISLLNLGLIGSAERQPFNQFDWPNPRPVTQPDRGFSITFTPSLVGKDQFPPGARNFDLTPAGYQYPTSLRIFSQSPAVPPVPIVVTTAVWASPFLSAPGALMGIPGDPPS